jgi:hypothetical protein
VEQRVVLAAGDVERLLLDGVEGRAADGEADEVARRADRDLPEDDLVGVPVPERPLPREGEQSLRRLPEAEARERRRAQRRFRR